VPSAKIYDKIHTMRYLLIEPKVKAIAPNIALTKWARWCEQNDYEYRYVRGKLEPSIEPDVILMSCIFSYNSKVYEKTIDFYLKRFPSSKITVGGAFPSLNPKWFDRWNGSVSVHKGLCKVIEKLAPKYDVDITSEDANPYPRDKVVLYASRGCVNKCGYCCVPKLEGDMRSFRSIRGVLNTARKEIPHAGGVVLYDNNFTEHRYFRNIVNELIEFGLPVDIHGLHVESFTRKKAQLLSKLNWQPQGGNGSAYMRFSFDKFKYADNIKNALRYTVEEDIKATFFCYVIYNWIDSPEHIWEKIQICQEIVDDIGEPIQLFFIRYEPLNSLKRNSYVGKRWSKDLLDGFAKMYENSKGFISISNKSRKLYEWIGHNQKEFLERIYRMGTDKDYKPIKTDRMKELVKNSEMEFHEIANIFPMMNAEEFEGLKSDIEKHGLLEPIWTYNGKIVDGRNRYLACQQLGIKPKLKRWKPVNGNELVDFVISLNLARRHLTSSQKAMVASDALPHFEAEAKKRQRLSNGRGKKGKAKVPELFGQSRDISAKMFGVSGRYVGYAKRIKKKDPKLAQKIRTGEKTIIEALNQIKKADRVNALKKAGKKFKPSNDIKVVCADFHKWCHENLEDNSIDLILTDPPYDKEHLPLWEKLAETASRVLKPSKFLVAYCGHVYMDRVIQILSNHLNYHWLYCLHFDGSGHKHRQKNIIKQWQPVLVYFKHPYKINRTSTDYLKYAGGDKGIHRQNQVNSSFRDFMENFSDPANLVLDPLMGTGGVLKIAKDLKRKAIGIDADSDCVEMVKGRLVV
jgi:hypothetical protein